jgi:hypothetical protein
MIKYEHLRREPPGKFKRATRLTKENFETLGRVIFQGLRDSGGLGLKHSYD